MLNKHILVSLPFELFFRTKMEIPVLYLIWPRGSGCPTGIELKVVGMFVHQIIYNGAFANSRTATDNQWLIFVRGNLSVHRVSYSPPKD